MKRILIVGNLGYVGPVLVKHLVSKKFIVDGLDTGFFLSNLTTNDSSEVFLRKQIFKDVRNIEKNDLIGYDGLIYLAAISNDPMGQAFKNQTMDINFKSAVAVAKLSKKVGVKSFLFASSCSVYGDSDQEIKSESSSLNPLTTYAESKILAERKLSILADSNFSITCLRFATACGTSERARLDLVVNDFVANSFINKSIKLLSMGDSHRPFISVSDMCRAFEWALKRSSFNGGVFCTLNVGNKNLNMTIIELANKISGLTGSKVSVSEDAQPDKRSYRVSYKKFYSLAKDYLPKDSMNSITKKLLLLYSENDFITKDFRNSDYIRLKFLNKLVFKKLINKNLYWNKR
tara:strand:- start:29366 stop:30406 length:1041 start_codon:yes stop_codon:yes gene_type:complete